MHVFPALDLRPLEILDQIFRNLGFAALGFDLCSDVNCRQKFDFPDTAADDCTDCSILQTGRRTARTVRAGHAGRLTGRKDARSTGASERPVVILALTDAVISVILPASKCACVSGTVDDGAAAMVA